MAKKKEYPNFNTFSDILSEPYVPPIFNREREVNNALRVLSLFSGCGGMDLGFEGNFICHKKSLPKNSNWIERYVTNNWVLLRGTRFKTIFANDILKEAQQTWLRYMSRFDVPEEIYHFGSIVDYVKMHNDENNNIEVFPNNVDVVTGGFPCQDFSVSGKREGFDSSKSHDGGQREIDEPSEETRGKLYYWMKQVIDIVRPKIFIAENVKGLVSLGDVKDIIQQDFASADGNGYIVLNPRVLDAGNFGVPETRERVIFVGIRRDALTPEALQALEMEEVPERFDPYPKPTHNHTAKDKSLMKPVTCRDVFEGLNEPDQSRDLSQRTYSKAKYMGKHCQGQSEIKMDGLGPTIRSEHHGNIEYRRLSKEHGGVYDDELEQGLIERRLTPRECALIQTFPPDYPFVFYRGYTRHYSVSPSAAYKVIGNAVPPMLAYNIAQRLQEIWTLYFG